MQKQNPGAVTDSGPGEDLSGGCMSECTTKHHPEAVTGAKPGEDCSGPKRALYRIPLKIKPFAVTGCRA